MQACAHRSRGSLTKCLRTRHHLDALIIARNSFSSRPSVEPESRGRPAVRRNLHHKLKVNAVISNESDKVVDSHGIRGFASLPGVHSPRQFSSYWSQVCRPKLEALYRAASSCPAKPGLLPIVDQLISEIKQVSVPARHCAQRHHDPAWRDAANDVANSCDKYEQYVYRSKGLYGKVRDVQKRLQLSLSNAVDGHASDASAQPTRVGSDSTWTVGVTDQYGRHATPEQLLRLATLLCKTFEAKGVNVQDGLSHLLAAHAPATLDTAWEEAGQYLQKDRSLADKVRSVISDVRIAPVLDLNDIHWTNPSRANNTDDQHNFHDDHDGSHTNGYKQQPPWDGDELLHRLVMRTPALSNRGDSEPGPAELPDNPDYHTDTDGQEQGTRTSSIQGSSSASFDGSIPSDVAAEHQSIEFGKSSLENSNHTEQPAAQGTWDDVILLDRSATSQLLRQHSNPVLRNTVMEEGVERRIMIMLQLIDKQAKVRGRISELYDAPSFAHVMQPEGSCAHGSPEDVLDRLKEIAQHTQAAAQKQVQLMLEYVQSERSKQQQQQDSKQAKSSHSNAYQQGTLAPEDIPAADMAYLQRCLMNKMGLNLEPGQLEAHLHLSSIIQGLSAWLHTTMGIRLHLVHQPSLHLNHRGNADSLGQETRADIWSPDQWVFHVYDTTHETLHEHGHDSSSDTSSSSSRSSAGEFLGVIHLDPGAGYGTRQLRFVHTWGHVPLDTRNDNRQQQDSSSYSSSSATKEAALTTKSRQAAKDQYPVVSIGLQWSWSNGSAESFSSVWELMHEMGHALHLVMSSHGQMFKHFGGLHLPLDILEIPSMFLEHCLVDTSTLQQILIHREDRSALPHDVASKLAQQYQASHYSALDFHDQVMIALFDQLMCMTPSTQEPDALGCYMAVHEPLAALPQAPATLKKLSVLPVMAHHRAMYWAYCTSKVVSSTFWRRTLAKSAVHAEWSRSHITGSASGVSISSQQKHVGALRGQQAGNDEIEGNSFSLALWPSCNACTGSNWDQVPRRSLKEDMELPGVEAEQLNESTTGSLNGVTFGMLVRKHLYEVSAGHDPRQVLLDLVNI